ncbi:mitochondrial genome maintenance exonuclease 1 [Dromaius novaehollandiae]|uniref:Mitochondrial genome maintenance exonuclease 1 n=2 Tax=Dromaius novaehollandiae TaxID=8790 RepID=A0A8C4J0T5_DRONO|nr:mitochondrial genome maintenance exonuclease 1 [Dromaius novaehollandiae]XP_025959998.1 mitochondrial genome maintenance exonuclease 1 [Dromaius novaehollandiae]XP_025959999.1 mitochondrial genome maintenance exonuclease 1 [Dromaius novaehollandiae]XP_025960000.1 mitochondrial genome maintenance exonuclease 1 [Dromaius novaehollandiae]XP_025960001.1 mitochondrial genome maintenance exonuclease 1 [Dromaius novaehollandiae]XP_025960002.1 mitochondrial genome maintenance exonuclease 1 [Dromaiu
MLLYRMKFLQLLSRKSGGLEMLVQVHFCQKQVPYMCLATSTCLYSKKKKVNGYEQVDQEKYKNLVCSVTSYKTSTRTPETLFEEDNLLCGPADKHRSPVKNVETKTPKNWVPLINRNKRIPLLDGDSNLPLKIGLQKTKIPSVTSILQQTIPPQQALYLEKWKQKMILKLGKDGFAEYTKNLFLQGKLFHATLESIFLSEEMPTKGQGEDTAISGYLSSVQHVLKDVSEVKALESAVQHEILQYLGLVDCVAKYRGQLCVIDWKTSEKSKPSLQNTFDNPLQVAAYIGAINHDVNYDFQVSCGLIVVAYKNGSPAHAHFMDPDLCSQYWNKWLLRLEEYMERN